MREIIFFKAILSVAFASKVQKNDLPYCPEGIGVYSKPNSDPSNTQLYMSKLWTWPKKGKISQALGKFILWAPFKEQKLTLHCENILIVLENLRNKFGGFHCF